MQFTKRNHFNPCFWTAFWNPAYYDNAIAGSPRQMVARKQQVHVLNIKSGQIYKKAVDNVHFDKNLGIAEITPAQIRDMVKRRHPDDYEQFCRELEDHPYNVFIDFETVLTGIENGPAYETLLEVITKCRIKTGLQRALLAGFVIVHWHRSHALLNSMIELSEEVGTTKFELLIDLKESLGNVNYLGPLTMTIAPFRWKYYFLKRDTFPLNDSPVFIEPSSVMMALSPRMLLVIDRTQPLRRESISCANFIPPDLLDCFRRRTIANTFREIIFSSAELLEEWRDSPEFQEL